MNKQLLQVQAWVDALNTTPHGIVALEKLEAQGIDVSTEVMKMKPRQLKLLVSLLEASYHMSSYDRRLRKVA